MVLENSTGEIKAMMGGRGAKGKQLYNRATSARQPGSSIKPIASYGPALQMSYEYAQEMCIRDSFRAVNVACSTLAEHDQILADRLQSELCIESGNTIDLSRFNAGFFRDVVDSI